MIPCHSINIQEKSDCKKWLSEPFSRRVEPFSRKVEMYEPNHEQMDRWIDEGFFHM